jgi:hypothetical protein
VLKERGEVSGTVEHVGSELGEAGIGKHRTPPCALRVYRTAADSKNCGEESNQIVSLHFVKPWALPPGPPVYMHGVHSYNSGGPHRPDGVLLASPLASRKM